MAAEHGEFDAVLATTDLTANPWDHSGDRPRYRIDTSLLQELVRLPLADGAKTQTGRLAKGTDAWVAQELRRAGFEPDEVWPRATHPRVLPRDVRLLMEKLPKKLREELHRRLQQHKNLASIAPAEARFLGRAYVKQVDVAMARWDRGPELMVSTKAMTSSFGNNVTNRFEESYGDAANLRARYPLAAVGYLLIQRATILTEEPAAFERSVDMMRKLRDRGDGTGYTATCLLLVEWDDVGSSDSVKVLHHLTNSDPQPSTGVPEDLGAPQFFESLIGTVLEATPVTEHVRARERYAGKELAVHEGE